MGKGFTIIELIVVIAIIAVLASIVLVNVTQYINKGKNAAIQGNLSSLMTNSAVYFEGNTTATGSTFIASTTVGCADGSPVETAIQNAGGTLTCIGDDATQAWCGTSPTLAAGATAASTFCVDSTGYKGVLGTDKCSGTTSSCQ